MWQIHAQMALDLARERAEEARQNTLAAQARQHAARRGAAPRAAPPPQPPAAGGRRRAPSGVQPVRLDQ